ncbi:CDP-glycerol glycerophosphotransferase family protein [Halomonas icarae]|uniref:Uncharacterized protein n=1 Tax=Halomonas icarae TaxID=2691040 RepID=A0A7X5AN57_9GAMM|nr:CDP-glycerol glycerophosphotransferase family protein [Halomonas icarae]MDR5902783.1 CDP-glycerol glycerophosphotransferase family protein [Halomonas icarae]NAW13338.1 hypothetical protein [Halomonas icarae]
MKVDNLVYKSKLGYYRSVRHNKKMPFNKAFRVKNAVLKFFLRNNVFRVFGFFVKKDMLLGGAGKSTYSFKIKNKKYPVRKILRISWTFRLCRYELFFYFASIPCEDFLDAEIHNAVQLCSNHSSGVNFVKRINYNFILQKLTKLHFFSKVNIWKEKGTSFYFRQSINGNLYLSVRKINQTDSRVYRYKIFLAYLSSFFVRRLEKFNKSVLVFEKECGKYEESGSVVYERLLDLGYDNVYFILTKEGEEKYFVPDKYKSNIVRKGSFKHYLLFFSSVVFISTESPPQVVDLRLASTWALHKLNKKDYTYVFLQHGVMYMVSLSSKAREGFKKGVGLYPDSTKIVVSSKLEAKHFIEQAGYEESDIYIVGLPKFDRAVLNESARCITIMPTWRPWEYNLIRSSQEESGYFKMVEEIFDSIPKEYKDRVVFLPHPLFIESFKNSIFSKFIRDDLSYDEVLRDTKILITDYSSIAYDSFNRGADVLFWWADKDFCMEQYGGKLMLNEENVFGPVAYNKESMRAHVESSINGSSDRKFYMRKYREIVFDFDGRSSDKLIERLKEDNLI